MVSELNIGYAWIIAIAAFVATVIVEMATTNGIYFPYMIDYYEESAAKVGMALTLITFLRYSCGVFSAIMAKAFGCRIVMIFGSITMICGYTLIAYSTSIIEVYLACCLIGFGICLSYYTSYFVIDVNFKKHFNLVMSIKVGMAGVGRVMSPYVCQRFVISYGWKHAFLLHSAVVYHLVLCGVIFRPSTKKKSNEEVEEISLLEVKQENNSPELDLQTGITPTDEKMRFNWLQYIYKICHLRLFKKHSFVILVVVALIQGATEDGVEVLMPDDMLERGASLHHSQLILAVYGASSICGRPFQYILSKFVLNDLLIQLGLSYFLSFLSLLICITTKTDNAVYVVMVFYGFSMGWYSGIIPLIVKSTVDDDFFFGYAWVECAYGVGACITVPFLGYLRDISGHFWLSEFSMLCFTLINIMIIFGFIVWKRTRKQGQTC
ncbi:monocarboxylate transporter 13-like isoform X1 [Anneissia japonica]|uniref:monocarboxylate transporter 13-like isoform X1 n=2 Tax=Anneissia japonica TaxID=1529436 RepID=UPI0014257630|nr:monocarboxylate transporter 13-like isoform X1 [Anneissia japonica]XP_033104555.1 monocarboxylate transporter 13-like isoform X1 [Anneissia japonica]